jgi:signal transduction histidine kinase
MTARRLRQLSRRRPLRLRLTLLYTGLYLLAAAVLLAGTYLLVARGGAVPAWLIADREHTLNPGCHRGSAGLTCRQGIRGALAAGAASQHGADLRHLLLYSLLALPVLTLASAGAGWLVAGRALRPVHAIAAAARGTSETNLTGRLALTGPDDELKELADTFDAMLDRLDRAFGSQQRFIADASHELRTPLTIIRTSIDVTLAKPDRTPAQLEQMAAEVRCAADTAEALIEALLALAASDAGPQNAEPLDLAVVTEDAIDAEAAAVRAGRLCVETLLRPAHATGDPILIEAMIGNLVHNAVRYNMPGGWLQVTTGTRGESSFVEVANTGPVVPPDLVPALFEPFRRIAQRTGNPDGVGLGLAIARSVATAHHGEISAHSRPAGGLCVTVLLPTNPAEPA